MFRKLGRIPWFSSAVRIQKRSLRASPCHPGVRIRSLKPLNRCAERFDHSLETRFVTPPPLPSLPPAGISSTAWTDDWNEMHTISVDTFGWMILTLKNDTVQNISALLNDPNETTVPLRHVFNACFSYACVVQDQTCSLVGWVDVGLLHSGAGEGQSIKDEVVKGWRWVTAGRENTGCLKSPIIWFHQSLD